MILEKAITDIANPSLIAPLQGLNRGVPDSAINH